MSSQRYRPVGLAALTNKNLSASTYASRGSAIRDAHVQALETQLSVFRQALEDFKTRHAKKIQSDPSFRAEFAHMCNAIGVDPLATSSRNTKDGSWWAQMRGAKMNNYYLELGVRIVEVCRESRQMNGGMIALEELRKRVALGVENQDRDIIEDDIIKAVELLKPLGGGYALVEIARRRFVRSVPKELSNDQSKVLEVAQVLGFISVSMLQANLNWEKVRCVTVVEDLVADGLLWVDMQAEEPEYWSPAWIKDGQES